MSSGFDLGLFNQAFWTTTNEGMLFYETADLSFNPGGSFLGVHFSPILFILLPFYAILPRVETLLVLQTAILAIGAFPVYWMAKDRIGQNSAFAIAVVYLAYPPLLLLNLNDFHVQIFTSTFFIFTLHYLDKKDWPKFLLFMILAMSSIEFAPIIGIFIVLYAFLINFGKNINFRTPLKSISNLKNSLKESKTTFKYILIATFLAFLFLFLALNIKELINDYTSAVPTTFQNILLNPSELPNVLLTNLNEKILYILWFLAPVAFLPFLVPSTLFLTLPWLVFSFLSPYSNYYSIFFQYNAFLIPFIIMALPKAVEKLKLSTGKILALILIPTILCSIYLPISPGTPWNYKLPIVDSSAELKREFLSLIPPDASILTQNDLFPHVSNRKNAYMYIPSEFPDIQIDYILVDVNSNWFKWIPEISGGKITPKGYTLTGLESGDYGVFAAVNSMVLLKKGYTAEPVLFRPFISNFNSDNLALASGLIIDDPSSESWRVLYSEEKGSQSTFWYGPYVDLTQGLYQASYKIKIENTSEIKANERVLALEIVSSVGKIYHTEKILWGANISSVGKWFTISLIFGLKIPADLVELRGITFGNHSVYLDYITLEQLSAQSITDFIFDYSDLPVATGRIKDETIVNSYGSGTFWYGPYINLTKGSYNAKFWLRLETSYDGPLLDIGILTDLGTKVITSQTIWGKNFTEKNKWQRFEVNFELLKDSTNVELSGIHVGDRATVSFLLVEVYPN